MSLSILVLDAQQRSALAMTRSLGRLPGVLVVTAERTADNLAGASRYSSEQMVYPCPESKPEEFVQWMTDIIRERGFNWVFPATEVTSQLLLLVQEQIPGLRLPFAPLAKVLALADKGALLERAKKLGIQVPESSHYCSSDELPLARLNYPLVVKPCLSKVYLQSKWLSTSVFAAFDRAELERGLLSRPYLKGQRFMVQEFVPGSGAGIFALYNQGKAIAFFAHQRVREKPPEGGISVLSRSVEVPPELERAARALLDDVKWHGVAMIEFRQTPAGEYFLMEVNTRFWGSLQLAIDSGVDFPALLLAACEGQNLPEQISYRHGQQLRWLLGDFDSLYLYCRGKYSWKLKLRRLLQFLNPLGKYLRYEVNRWDDLGPAWQELKDYFRQMR